MRGKGTGTIFKPKGSKFYWIGYFSGGKRHYESTKSTRKEDAQALLTQRLGDIGKGLPVTPKLGKLIVGDALNAVISDLELNGRKDSKQTQGRIKDHLLKFFPSDRRMNTLTTGDMEAYQRHRVNDEKAKPATVNRELAVMRRAFRLALRGGQLAMMPHVPMLKENNIRTGFFEREMLDAIKRHLPIYLHPLLEFLYVTGWRKSEALNLEASRVDLKAGVVTLAPGTTKSGEGRTIYLTPALQALLKKQLASIETLKKQDVICPYVFHRPDGSQIVSFRKLWRNACTAAGFKRLIHDFRRTAVRNLERAAVPRSTAMAMVGHKTESIYRRYAIQDEAMLREGAAKLAEWTTQQQQAKRTRRTGQLAQFKRQTKAG